jgi:hypothetical protein
VVCVTAVLACAAMRLAAAQENAQMVLPEGVRAVWDVGKAQRESTPTRERVCINGLWRWQPAAAAADTVPAGGWGYFKVPGEWPREANRGGSQTLYPHPDWKGRRLGDVTAAWYQREISVPAEWAGRRIAVSTEYLNSFASVYLDGRKAGEMRFPWGEVDLTEACRPGRTHVLSMLVVAMPLRAVMLSYNDTFAAREVAGSVARKGLCGDVYLVGTPAGARISDVKVETSVQKWEVTFNAALEGLAADGRYVLRAQVMDNGRSVPEFTGEPFGSADLKDGRAAFTRGWKPEKLWDIHTPQNMYEVSVSLLDADGTVLDTALPERFGFREFWIKGRDFYLNGSRVFLSSVPLNHAQNGAALANYGAVHESLKRLQSFGVNFVYTGNYGCPPGSHLSFEEVLRASDDAGTLVALSQPHYGHYDWQAADADQKNGYAQHAEFYAHVAGNHPSVVFYAMNHNANGYDEQMNPDMIDGIEDPHNYRAGGGPARARLVEAIVKRLDPTRIVYHHASGNMGSVFTDNFYPNWVPIQEMSEWFEHWATVGVKPFLACEYAAPSTWEWAMYRGWFRGGRSFGSASVPWELCIAEWNSQFFGDKAFQISEWEKDNLRWEAKQFRAGNLWRRWSYPHDLDAHFDEREPIFAMYITDNFRAFRTLGVSATNLWQNADFWKLRPGVDRGRKELRVDWDKLQRPGLSPDYVEDLPEQMYTAYEPSDWIPMPGAQALIRNNVALLAYIGGKPAAFTSKDHNFLPGEAVEKQLIVINNSRQTVTCDCAWSFGLPKPITGSKSIALPTGEQERVPLSFELPAGLAPGQYTLTATVKFSNGETQDDSFAIDVLARPAAPEPAAARVALFDPKGESAKLLDGMGVRYQAVDAGADLSAYDTLIVGKAALTPDGPAPDIARVRDGLKVVMFEQTADVLEKRFGFRVEEYGLRWVFKRVPDHPLLAGIADEQLGNWRGEATILPPRLNYKPSPKFYGAPGIEWCGINVPRLWRCGNRGNVASVLIEKPACGDFLPILDGGYSIQYSSLMQYREGKGMVLFCQMDVTGRTEDDPAAQTLARNIVSYASAWKPSPVRQVLYVGGPPGRLHLERAGILAAAYDGGKLSPDQVLVVGAGGGQKLATNAGAVGEFLKGGGNLLAVGLDEQEANAFLPAKVQMKVAEHIAAYFEPFGRDSLLAGVSPADVHNKDPKDLPLVSGGATVIGDGVLGQAGDAKVVFCQLTPYGVGSAQGSEASFAVSAEDAADGKQSALLTLGFSSDAQFGQEVVKAGEVGKSYTFAVLLKAEGAAVPVHLEIERPASPWDRALKAPDVLVAPGEWTEVHATFKVEVPFPEGWFAYLSCAQGGACFRADAVRLYEGEYVPWKAAGAGQEPGTAQNLIANPSFEAGAAPWRFTYNEQYNLRRTYRRASFLVTRLLANMGAACATPVLERFHSPVDMSKAEKRWLAGLYVDVPIEWDDPYRFFCW